MLGIPSINQSVTLNNSGSSLVLAFLNRQRELTILNKQSSPR